MKSQPVLRSIGSNSLAGILVLLLLPAVTEADGDLSLNPNHPSACDMLTIQWPPTQAQSYSVEIVDKKDSQTLFQTNVTSPTTSVEWSVNATKGASLHLAVHTPPDWGSQHYEATDFQVLPGPTSCPTSEPPTAATPAPSNPTTSSTPPLSSTPASSAATPSATATLASQTPTAVTSLTSSTQPTTAGTSSESPISGSASQAQSGTSGDTSNLGPPASIKTSSSTLANPSATFPLDTSPSRSASPSHSPLSSGAIASVVVGSLAGIALVLLALYLCRRRARRRTGAQAVSPFLSHIGWLPQLSRSSYQAESLCSDSHLSEVESEKPIAAWNPRLFVREKTYAVPSRSPLVQHSSLPSGTAVTVASAEEGTQA